MMPLNVDELELSLKILDIVYILQKNEKPSKELLSNY